MVQQGPHLQLNTPSQQGCHLKFGSYPSSSTGANLCFLYHGNRGKAWVHIHALNTHTCSLSFGSQGESFLNKLSCDPFFSLNRFSQRIACSAKAMMAHVCPQGQNWQRRSTPTLDVTPTPARGPGPLSYVSYVPASSFESTSPPWTKPATHTLTYSFIHSYIPSCTACTLKKQEL